MFRSAREAAQPASRTIGAGARMRFPLVTAVLATLLIFSGSSPAPPAYADNDSLSSSDVASQVADANKLAAQIASESKSIDALVKSLQASAKEANTKLQAYAESNRKANAASAKATAARNSLNALQKRLQRARETLRAWAVEAYTQGGDYAQTMATIDALTKMSTDDSQVSGLSDLNFITSERAGAVALIRQSRDIQAKLTRQREDAEKEAQQARVVAARERREVDALIARQKKRLITMRTRNAATLKSAGPLALSLMGLNNPRATAAKDRLVKALKAAGGDVSSLTIPQCSGDNSNYANGYFPPSALCTILGGGQLRPKAANAFNAMSAAYARTFGSLICVRDSYRSYAGQVAMKASRGRWAATPGFSEHGLGLALDLCGGIENFGSQQHAWMQQNAPLYGFFHPSWAAAGGSLPEPWHWEYGG